MLRLVEKNLKVVLASRSFFVLLGTFWILPLLYRSSLVNRLIENQCVLTDTAYVLNGFLMSVILFSILDNAETRHRTEKLYASLPISRTAMVIADYMTCFVLTLFSIGYIVTTALLFNLVFPENFLTGQFITIGEVGFILVVTGLAVALNEPMSCRFGTLTQRPAALFTMIMTTLVVCFYVVPLLMLHLVRSMPGTCEWQCYGPLAPAMGLVNAITRPGPGFTVVILTIGLLLVSMRLSVVIYGRKDM